MRAVMLTQRETKADWVTNAWDALCGCSILRNEWLSHTSRRMSLVWTIFKCTKTGTKFWRKKSSKTESYENWGIRKPRFDCIHNFMYLLLSIQPGYTLAARLEDCCHCITYISKIDWREWSDWAGELFICIVFSYNETRCRGVRDIKLSWPPTFKEISAGYIDK